MPGRAAIFLDTAHVLALTNERDQWHAVALRWSERIAADGLRLITTWIMYGTTTRRTGSVSDGVAAERLG
jgi:predicted nucleic acid-binding protein